MFFIPCDDWKILFFIQIFRYPEVWRNRHVAVFFKIRVLKEVRILYPFIRYLHNNIKILLIPKIPNKVFTS